MNKKLLVLGAGFLQRFVIRRAKEMGYFVVAVDGAADAPGLAEADEHAVVDIADPQACLRYAEHKGIDGVLCAATDYAVEAAAGIAEALNLPGNKLEVARLVKDKYRTRVAMEKAGVGLPGAFLADISQRTHLPDKIAFPVMVKPCDGSGSRGTVKVEALAGLEQALLAAWRASRSGRALIEPYIVGQEYGVELIVVQGEPRVLAIMRKWMTPPPYYAELGHAMPSGLTTEREAAIARTAIRAVKALGIITGAVNMDVLLTDEGGVHIVDIGARMGGNLIGSHLVPLGAGYDEMGNLIRMAVGDAAELPDGGTAKQAVATRILALSSGVVERLPDFKALERELGIQVLHHLTTGGRITPYRTNLDGCGYVLARGDTMHEAVRKADAALQRIDQSIIRET